MEDRSSFCFNFLSEVRSHPLRGMKGLYSKGDVEEKKEEKKEEVGEREIIAQGISELLGNI